MTASPEFGALLAEYHDAQREMRDPTGSEDIERCRKLEERYVTAYTAVFAARPTDPQDLAAYLRWLASESAAADDADLPAVLEHVAEQIEAIVLG